MNFTCQISKGKLISDSNLIKGYVSRQKDGEYILEIRKSTRGKNQNAFYWGFVVKLIADETGETDYERMHDIFKFKFNQGTADFLEEKLTLGMSTTKLTYEEFDQYVDRIRTWAKNVLNIEVPIMGQPTEIDI